MQHVSDWVFPSFPPPAWLFKGGNFWYILFYQYHHQSQGLNPTFSLFTSSMIHTYQFTKLTFCQSRRQRLCKKILAKIMSPLKVPAEQTYPLPPSPPLSPSLSLSLTCWSRIWCWGIDTARRRGVRGCALGDRPRLRLSSRRNDRHALGIRGCGLIRWSGGAYTLRNWNWLTRKI